MEKTSERVFESQELRVLRARFENLLGAVKYWQDALSTIRRNGNNELVRPGTYLNRLGSKEFMQLMKNISEALKALDSGDRNPVEEINLEIGSFTSNDEKPEEMFSRLKKTLEDLLLQISLSGKADIAGLPLGSIDFENGLVELNNKIQQETLDLLRQNNLVGKMKHGAIKPHFEKK